MQKMSVLIIEAVILSLCAYSYSQAFFVPKMDMYMEKITKLERRTAFRAMNIVPDVRAGYTVKFRNIVMNVGGRYNSTTGLFTAAINGTYLFSVTICVIGTRWFKVHIEADDMIIATLPAIYQHATCHSTTGLVGMAVGQIAKVKCNYYTAGALYQDKTRIPSFSGVLLYPDQETYLNYTLPTSVGHVDKYHPLLLTALLCAYTLLVINKNIP